MYQEENEKDIETVIPPVDFSFLEETNAKTEATILHIGHGMK